MKKIILLKKKKTPESLPEDNSSLLSANLKTFSEFSKEIQVTNPNHETTVIRKWYEKLFKQFPPWNKYGFKFCKARIAYALVVEDHKAAGMKIPATVERNYKATQAFKINELSDGILKFSILSELKQPDPKTNQTGEDQMAKQIKGKEAKPKKERGEKVYQTWVRLFEENTAKKLSDTRIAEVMSVAHPDKKKYSVDDVRRHRSLYNNGRIAGQKGKPKTASESFDKPVKEEAKKAKGKVVLKKKKA